MIFRVNFDVASMVRRGSTSDRTEPAPPGEPDFARIQRGPKFRRLRGGFRRFVFPMTFLFVAWYVILAAYAHNFMWVKLFSQINVAIALGILQFISTGIITIFALFVVIALFVVYRVI